MKIRLIQSIAIIAMTVFLVAPSTAQSLSDENSACKLPKLRTELLKRMEVDQAARRKITLNAKSGDPTDVDQKLVHEIQRVDTENRKWMVEQIEQHGWLGKSLVGVDGAHAAWLIVQHADLDKRFQRQCLDQMKMMPDGEVAGTDIAYLTDRVRVGEGKKQLYGTQLELVDGKLQVKPVEDPDNLDKRRAKHGLMPIAKYLEMASRHFLGESKADDKTGKSTKPPGSNDK